MSVTVEYLYTGFSCLAFILDAVTRARFFSQVLGAHGLVCFPVPLISWITILFGPIVSDAAYVSGFGNIPVSDSFGQRYVPASLFDQLDYVGSLCIYECA